MKKVLFITTVKGFLYQFERENVRILQDMGYEVHYASNGNLWRYEFDEKEIESLGVIFHPIDIEQSPYERKKNSIALQQIEYIIRKEDIRLIHCHTPVGGMLGRMAGKRTKDMATKVIYTTHGFHFYKGAPASSLIFKIVERYLAKSTDVIVTINEEDFRTAKKFKLKKGGAVYKIPGEGINLRDFTPLSFEEKKSFRQKLGIDDDTFFILSVGEFTENKNHSTILNVIEKIIKDGYDLGKFVYGICGDGFYRDEIQKRIQEKGLSEKVRLFGYCHPIREYTGCADVFIYPSRREGLGMAAIEALAMGVPVIAADNRGTREYMKHGQNGYVNKWNDVQGYIDNIVRLKGLSPVKLNIMKNNCTESVRGFEKSISSALMNEIYQQIDKKYGEMML